MNRRGLLLAAAALALAGTPARAQQRDGRCLLQVLNVDHQGVGQQPSPGTQNWFGGGNVRIRCVGQEVRMWSDSVASYQGEVVQFIGSVRYRDSTIEMTADFGTYFRTGDRWEARGNVVLTNRQNGSVLRGPMLDYLRAAPGVRDTSELWADLRPVITVPARDSLNRPEDPYLIVGDRVRIRGNDRLYAGGRVTIDRFDLAARGDSLRLDTGAGSDGTLMGAASVRRVAADSFRLTGRRIDLALERRALRAVLARDEGHLTSAELDLVADRIGIAIADRKVERVTAWGDSLRPVARSVDGYEIRGDSLAFDTPEQRLREARTYGEGWVGAAPDSVTGERDWVAGDSVTVSFLPGEDSTGAPRSTLERLDARGAARAFYRLPASPQVGGGPSISYTRADRIEITMKQADGTATVDRVTSTGNVDGIHLQPAVVARDTTRAAPRPPGVPPR